MWITRAAFDTLNAERIKATEEARTLAQQNAHLTTMLGWFQHRCEQVERERAHLLQKYMGVQVAVPSWVKPESNQDELIAGANLFKDMGDEEAKRLGVDWDAEGRIKQ